MTRAVSSASWMGPLVGMSTTPAAVPLVLPVADNAETADTGASANPAAAAAGTPMLALGSEHAVVVPDADDGTGPLGARPVPVEMLQSVGAQELHHPRMRRR